MLEDFWRPCMLPCSWQSPSGMSGWDLNIIQKEEALGRRFNLRKPVGES